VPRFRPLPPALIRWTLGIAAVLLTAAAQWGSPLWITDEWLRDRYAQVAVSTAPEPRILVVDIDETSLREVGPWPWSHAQIADLAELLLTRYEAKGVALDIVLPKVSDPEASMRLAALASHGPLVLAQAFDYSLTRPEPLREGTLGGALAPQRQRALPATGFLANHASLSVAARHIGNIGFLPDPDGALRRLPLLTSFQGKQYPALSLALMQCCGGGTIELPPDSSAVRVAFNRDWNAYTVVSAADVLSGALSPDGASGRLVLVGSSSLSLADRVTTPLAASRPGLGVQATMLSNLLDWRDGKAPSRWPGRWMAIGFAAVLSALAMYALPRLAATRSVALLGVCTLLWLTLAGAISMHDPAFSPSGPLLSALFLLAVAVPYQWQLSQDRSRNLLNTLRQYVAPSVVDELLKSDLADPLAPRQLEVTTLIADMQGYTNQVESLPVEEAAKLTRDFLECLTAPVIEQQGTLDKYTGDGLVAFWGAPLPNAAHADLALDAAREMERRVALLSKQREALGRPPLKVRIGIESGVAMAGDFGTAFRSIYTAVGDSVNTASRLENAARDFPHSVIVGAGTVQASTRHSFLKLGERQLRGKEKLTILYTLVPDMTVQQDNQTGPARVKAAEQQG
jgi:adenylate cyclase